MPGLPGNRWENNWRWNEVDFVKIAAQEIRMLGEIKGVGHNHVRSIGRNMIRQVGNPVSDVVDETTWHSQVTVICQHNRLFYKLTDHSS